MAGHNKNQEGTTVGKIRYFLWIPLYNSFDVILKNHTNSNGVAIQPRSVYGP